MVMLARILPGAVTGVNNDGRCGYEAAAIGLRSVGITATAQELREKYAPPRVAGASIESTWANADIFDQIEIDYKPVGKLLQVRIWVPVDASKLYLEATEPWTDDGATVFVDVLAVGAWDTDVLRLGSLTHFNALNLTDATFVTPEEKDAQKESLWLPAKAGPTPYPAKANASIDSKTVAPEAGNKEDEAFYHALAVSEVERATDAAEEAKKESEALLQGVALSEASIAEEVKKENELFEKKLQEVALSEAALLAEATKKEEESFEKDMLEVVALSEAAFLAEAPNEENESFENDLHVVALSGAALVLELAGNVIEANESGPEELTDGFEPEELTMPQRGSGAWSKHWREVFRAVVVAAAATAELLARLLALEDKSKTEDLHLLDAQERLEAIAAAVEASAAAARKSLKLGRKNRKKDELHRKRLSLRAEDRRKSLEAMERGTMEREAKEGARQRECSKREASRMHTFRRNSGRSYGQAPVGARDRIFKKAAEDGVSKTKVKVCVSLSYSDTHTPSPTLSRAPSRYLSLALLLILILTYHAFNSLSHLALYHSFNPGRRSATEGHFGGEHEAEDQPRVEAEFFCSAMASS
jgi:hypothetical protein